MVFPFDALPVLYFSTSDDGTILEVNDHFTIHLGYKKEEIQGKKMDLISTVATRIFHQTHFFPLLRLQKKVEEIFITLKTKNGEDLPVLINASRTEEGEPKNIYTGIVVHNRKKFEDELVAARKEAETALHENRDLLEVKKSLEENTRKLESQVSLVQKQNAEFLQLNRVVTHNLQEPLRKLSIFNSLLVSSEEIDESMMLKKIDHVSRQMQSVVSGLQQYLWLAESTIKTGDLDFNTLLMEVVDEVSAKNEDVNIYVDTSSLPALEADKEQISFLLRELFANSIRFKQEVLPLKIHLSVKEISLNWYQSISQKYEFIPFLRLELKDNGVGFDDTYKSQVFELFRRLHDISGSGVGLALCRKIVENHQGRISIDSVKGVGTRVMISIPFAQNIENA